MESVAFLKSAFVAQETHKGQEAVIYVTILPQAQHCGSSCSLGTSGPSDRARKERLPQFL